ncbi:Regulator of microtubule dynamics protein [Dirofilaria immitis]
MLHVFNGPVEPVSLAEFQKAKEEKTLFSCQTKRKITYHKDGRRFVGDKIENEQNVSSLWSTTLTRSIAQDLKDRSNEDPNLRNLGLTRYASNLLQQLMLHCDMRITFGYLNYDIIFFLRYKLLAGYLRAEEEIRNRMLSRALLRLRRLVSLNDGRIQTTRGMQDVKRRFGEYKRARRVFLGATAMGTTGFTLLSFLDMKLERNDVSKETLKLERFKREADTLYNVYLIENAYNVLRRFSSGSDPQMLWRLARVLYEKAKMSKDKNDKKRFMYDALKMAKKALDNESEESCWEVHKWYAIVLSYVSEYEGTREQIRQSFEVRKHLEKALDINSTDATTWHALGVWYFTFADLSSWKATIVKSFYGSVPLATYEDALRCFQKAEFIKPNSHSSNLWYLAEVKTRLGQTEEAFELYKAAFKMPIITMDDGDTHDKAYEKLRKLGVKDFTKL